jgi:hypothetical protein
VATENIHGCTHILPSIHSARLETNRALSTIIYPQDTSSHSRQNMFPDSRTYRASLENQARVRSTPPVRPGPCLVLAFVYMEGAAARVNIALERLDVRLAASRRFEAPDSPPSALVGPGHAPVPAFAPSPVAVVVGR